MRERKRVSERDREKERKSERVRDRENRERERESMAVFTPNAELIFCAAGLYVKSMRTRLSRKIIASFARIIHFAFGMNTV